MSALTVLWRQFNQERWPALILALSVAILSLVAGVVPRLMSDLDDRQLNQELSSLSSAQGDVIGVWSYDPWTYGVTFTDQVVEDPWAPHHEAGEAIHAAQPEPLRSLLAAPQFVGESSHEESLRLDPGTGYHSVTFHPQVDPQLSQHAELVDGQWPAIATSGPGADGGEPRTEVAILEEVAQRAGLEVGSDVGQYFVVTGVFRPVDDAAPRWEHVPQGRHYSEEAHPDLGLILHAGLFLPEAYHAAAPRLDGPLGWEVKMAFRMWFGLDPAALQSGGIDVAQLSGQLSAMLAQSYPVSTDEGADVIRLGSELNAALGRVIGQQGLTRSVLAVAAVGPLAVAVALVVLSARLVLQRRRTWLELVHARGLAPEQARWLAVAEGALLSIPAAAVGHLAALALIPGPRPAVAWLGAALVALLAPAVLAFGAGRWGAARGRTDLSSRGGRWRVVGEVLAVAAAVAATWQLLTRPDDAATGGIDLLAAAAPVLWALAVGLLLLRLYPVPLQLLVRTFRRGRGLTGLLGAARSLRDPAGGVIPIITVLLGTTLAVMGATLLGTITTGTERAVWEANGSHVRVSGPRMTDPRVEELRGIDGVAAVARIYDAADNAKLELDGEEVWARLLLADPEIVDVYRPLPEGSPVPPSLFDEASMLLGGELADTAASATVPGLGSVPVVASLENLPGGSYGSAWVLADVTRWTQQAPTSNAALIAVDPGADIREVAERVALQVPNSRVTDVAAQLETLRDSQTVDGLTRAFLILAGATVALMALGVIGSQLLSGRERNHLAAVLRTFGLRPGQLRGLTAWEVGPAIVLALLVGVSLGIALAWLMLNGLDFTVLTGGEHVPQLHLHWPSLAVVLGALIATMALAVAVMSWLAGRTYVAQELRIGEQR